MATSKKSASGSEPTPTAVGVARAKKAPSVSSTAPESATRNAPSASGTAPETTTRKAPSKQRPGGLGRGLGELFVRTDGENPASAAIDIAVGFKPSEPIKDGSWFAEIPVDRISPNENQPRQFFDDEALDELAASVTEVGLLQPIVVRLKGHDNYELVMGERRWRAHQRAGLKTIPAIVRATDDGDMLRDALLENLHRVQLNPLEEAAAYQQMIDDFGLTQDELAGKLQMSRPRVSNTIRLLRLPPTVQRRVAAGVLSAGHARALLALDDPADQEALATRIVAEGLSVRATEETVTLQQNHVDKPKHQKTPSTMDADPEAAAAETALAERLDTRVHVRPGKTHGTIAIDYADDVDLARIMALLLDGHPAAG